MSAHHLHVITPVLTLWVVLCALVMMDMYWIMMDCPAMVSKHRTCINTLTLFISIYRTSYCNAAKSNSTIH